MIDIARINEELLALFKIKFVKDTLILQAGTLVIMGTNFATSVLLARTLQPERYGIYALVFSLYGLIGLFGNVGVGQATVTRLAEAYAKGDEEEITNLLAFFVKMSAIMATFISIVGFLVLPYLAARMYGDPEIGHVARPLFLIAPLGVMYGLVTTILQSVRMMQQLTILESLMTILTSALVIGFVLLDLGVRGIVYGHVLATLLSSAIGLFIYHRLRWQLGSALPSLREALSKMGKVKIREYFTFGFLIAVDKNIAKLYAILPIALLGMFVAASEVGYFKIAFSSIEILAVPFGVITRNLATKLPESKYRNGVKNLKHIFLKVSLCSGLMSAIIAIGFLILAPRLITILYGRGYIPSVNMMYILSLYFIATGFGVGLGPLYRTLQKVELAILAKLITLCTIMPLSSITILVLGRNPNGTMMALILSIMQMTSIVIHMFLFIRQMARS